MSTAAGKTCLAVAVLMCAGANAHAAQPSDPGWGSVTSRISAATDGSQTRGEADPWSAVSGSGRFVAFAFSGQLLAEDTHRGWDLYVLDRLANKLEIVSVSPDGEAVGGGRTGVAMSDNGRFIAFTSRSGGVVRGDSNGAWDVFVRDRWRGRTQRGSVASDGRQANGNSTQPSLSADGRMVSYSSFASNLTPCDRNGELDVFVHDRLSRTTSLVSVADGGARGNSYSGTSALSPGGAHVAFVSAASNLVADDTNEVRDVFVRNLDTDRTRRVSVSNAEQPAELNGYSDEPSLSGNGRFVVFQSGAENLIPRDDNNSTDVFVRDRAAGTTRLVSVSTGGRQGDSGSGDPSISASGRFVAFDSSAQLVPSPSVIGDIYLRDLLAGTTQIVSVPAADDDFTDCCSARPEISADGHHVSFSSTSRKIVAGESDLLGWDVFARDQAADAER